MRLRINTLSLVGTSRTVELTEGLNVIEGPISTGKSSLMRLFTVALGGDYDGISPEVGQAVSHLAANLTIGDRSFAVVRRLVTTATALVEVAGDGIAERLPALRPTPGSETTYGLWLLNALGLPTLRVPEAPTRPEESAFIPVSINDYLRYCRIRQDEIDVDVLGSSLPFRDIKRRYVFRILYGGYDAEVAQLQEELRRLQTELTLLEQGTGAFERFVVGTTLENRAEVLRQLDEAHERLAALNADRVAFAESVAETPDVAELRTRLAGLSERSSDLHELFSRERTAVRQLDELRNELRTQLARLTRAIVAGERLFDFDFVVCPRCGATVDSARSDDAHCYLCSQEPPPAPTREDLIAEQDRVGAQIVETQELVSAHSARAAELEEAIAAVVAEREATRAGIDERLATYVSTEADKIEALARAEADVAATVSRLEEYARLFGRLDDAAQRIDVLVQRRAEIEAALERAEELDAITASRIQRLDGWFANYVDRLEVPVFAGEPRAAIDRSDYQPIVNGRKFPQLSAGVRVLVNVAHILAHHRAALDLDLPLPGLLMIDGINKNIGTAEYDAARIEDVWTQLIALADELGSELQIIVAANDVPQRAREFVQLTLSAEERLIPEADLERTR